MTPGERTVTVDSGPLLAIGICVVSRGFDLPGDGRRDALARKSGR